MLLLCCVGIILAACICARAWEAHVAPMVGFTDRHMRSLLRIANPNAFLWTEMIKPEELLAVSDSRRHSMLSRGADGGSCILQLGGNNADELCQSIRLAEEGGYGYSEFNLNCGCPSVHSNAPFGAALMRSPESVLYFCDRMASVTDKPISVKCRIGIHDSPASMTEDQLHPLVDFIGKVTGSGSVKGITIHSRAAVLSGLSIDKNRQVPPLRADLAREAALAFPQMRFILNGELKPGKSPPEPFVGAMYGRVILRDPLALLHFTEPCLGSDIGPSAAMQRRVDIVNRYSAYADRQGLSSLLEGESCVKLISPLALAYMSATEGLESSCSGNDGGDITEHHGAYIRALLASIVRLLLHSKTSERDRSKLASLAVDIDGSEDPDLGRLCGPVGRALKEVMGKKLFGKMAQTRAG